MLIHNPDIQHSFKRYYIEPLKKNKNILSLFIGLIGLGLIVGMAEASQSNLTMYEHQRNASFGSPSGGSGTRYKVKMFDGREGLISGPPMSNYFETNRVYAADIGGGSTLIEKKVLRIKKMIIFDFGEGKRIGLRKGDFLLVTGEDPDWLILETLGGWVGTWDKEQVLKDGEIETISWYADWDAMRERKGPIILLIIITAAFTTLVPFTIYNDPRHKEKGGRKAVSLIYFGLASFGTIGYSLTAFRGSTSLIQHLSLRRFDVILEMISYSMLIPYGVVVTFFFEGFVVFLIRCKYLFSHKTAEEALMERTKAKEDEATRKKYETKKDEIKTRQTAIQKRLSNLRSDLPEVIDAIPADLTDYQGYWNEVEKRFQERQIMKTTKVARERLEEVRMLCEEGAKLQRARADLEMANHEFSTVDKEISLKDKERTLKDKVLDRDILETDADIARLKRMSEKKEEREDFGI